MVSPIDPTHPLWYVAQHLTNFVGLANVLTHGRTEERRPRRQTSLTLQQQRAKALESVWLADPLMPEIVDQHQNDSRWMRVYGTLVVDAQGKIDPKRLYRFWNHLPLADPAPRKKSPGRPRRFATAALFRPMGHEAA